MSNHTTFHYALAFLLTLLLVASGYGLWRLHESVDASQEIKYDLAVLQDARYGVLNVHEWKRQVSVIISNKIDEFDINPANEGKLKAQIESALYKLIDELQKFLKKEEGQGSVLEKMVKSMAYNVAFDVDKFKAQVPIWSVQILEEIDNEENRKELKDYIREKIEELLQMEAGDEDTAVLDAAMLKYGCVDREDCGHAMRSQLATLEQQASRWGSFAILAIALLFFLAVVIKRLRVWGLVHVLMILGCLLVLYGGLSLPMIDIDARISSLGFNLMGEEVSFKDQVLFFQSKSILDVVRLLLEQDKFETVGVGFLILLFSVIFPLTKMLASTAVVSRPTLLSKNRLVRFLVLKSGKWSMADVFVVAIFMSYIGFRGIINSQLRQLERANETVNMISTYEYTTLQEGFVLFTGFCILSLVLSTILDERRAQTVT